MPLGTEIGLGPDHIVLDGDSAPLPTKRGQSPPPQFSVHVYCGQTAEWVKIPLGTEVGLGPGDKMETQLPSPQKGDRTPNFRPMSTVAKYIAGWIGPGHIVLDWDPAPPPP